MNGAAAAVRAGYGAKNARSTASELLALPEVAAAVAAAQAERAKRTAVTADQVVLELARVAFADIRQLVTWTGRVDPQTGARGTLVLDWKDSAGLTDAAAAAVAEVSHGRDGFKLKLHPKVRALELLARHLGMFQELGSGASGDEVRLTPENVGELAARARLRVVQGAR